MEATCDSFVLNGRKFNWTLMKKKCNSIGEYSMNFNKSPMGKCLAKHFQLICTSISIFFLQISGNFVSTENFHIPSTLTEHEERGVRLHVDDCGIGCEAAPPSHHTAKYAIHTHVDSLAAQEMFGHCASVLYTYVSVCPFVRVCFLRMVRLTFRRLVYSSHKHWIDLRMWRSHRNVWFLFFEFFFFFLSWI